MAKKTDGLKKMPCPRCGAVLEQSGELKIDGQTCAVCQCDHCVVPQQILGGTFDAALTFAVGPDGKPFDPAAGPDSN